jgi:hypothetical protein
MTSLPVTSTCAFLADTFTDTFTVSTYYLVITTIVVSVDCTSALSCSPDFLVQCLPCSVVRPLGLLCKLIIFPELVRCSILDFLRCHFPSRLPLYNFLTVNPFKFVFCLQSLLVRIVDVSYTLTSDLMFS